MQTNHSIQLVEDDIADQEFFIEALKEIKNATLYDIAGNGREALGKLHNPVNLPAIIFMDIEMPVINGIDCLKAISQMEHLNNIPVIILTDYSEHIEMVRELGAKALIRKPWNVKVLSTHIERMINLDFIAGNHAFYTILN